jgi:sec-independent protein translocase protein TatA
MADVFGIGAQELIFILVLALLIFGPKRLPQLGRTLGKGMMEFRKASTELQRAFNTELEESPAQRYAKRAVAQATPPPADPLPAAEATASALGEAETAPAASPAPGEEPPAGGTS